MNRRWQKEGVGRYDTLPSLSWLLQRLPPLPTNLGIADVADVYSVLSALHSKGRNPEPAACLHGGFYYVMADQPAAALAQTEDRRATDQAVSGLRHELRPHCNNWHVQPACQALLLAPRSLGLAGNPWSRSARSTSAGRGSCAERAGGAGW
jgi:hypothetical protein